MPVDNPNSAEQPLISHLIELRQRLLNAVLGIFVVLLPLLFFSSDIYTWLAGPLLQHMPDGQQMIATQVASTFLAPFKLTVVLSIILALPWVLYQLWAFVAPGLYHREKRLVFPLLATSTGLFYLGMAFAYFVVFPLVFKFFVSIAPAGVMVMTDISSYLDFVLKLFMAFGIAFEVPVAILLLVSTGTTTPSALAEKRPYVFLGAFVMGMLLTPPDVISQCLLAVPVYALYELGIVLARRLVPGIQEVEAQRRGDIPSE